METNKITYKLIEQYIQGALDEKAMHELERQALKDPFLADALEGYKSAPASVDGHLSLLQRQLEERIALQQEKKNLFYFSWQRISVAAAACLLFISASILFWMKGSRLQPAGRSGEKAVEVSLMSADSLQSLNYSGNVHSDVSPVGGWKAFEQYLNKGNGSRQTGEVTLSFDVAADGAVTNVNVLKSSSVSLNEDAELILKRGPKWDKPGARNVIVRIKF